MWVRSTYAVWRNVLDDIVVADGQGEEPPYALAGGSRLWQYLVTARTSTELAALLETSQAGAAEALEQLLVDLWRRGIVRRSDG
jgi:hypothetical protein